MTIAKSVNSKVEEGLPESFVKNCLIKSKGEILFSGINGMALAHLDGYAIIPMEEYERLKQNAGEME